jgi:hypothetical protein
MEINAGQRYVQSATVPGRPDEVVQQLTGQLATVPGYTMTGTGSNSLVLTRRFMPQWALITGIIAGLLTCIGFLVLLVKEEETLSITANPTDGGTRLDISGAASPAMSSRLPAVIAGLGGQVGTSGMAPGFAAPPRPVAPAPAASGPPPPPESPPPRAPTPPAPPPPAASANAPGGPAAWHPDPAGRHEQRYWDGSGWTEHVSDGGTPGTDPPPA